MECLFVLLVVTGVLAVVAWQTVRWLLQREVPGGPARTGREGMVGLIGVVTRQVDGRSESGRGQIRVRGELWKARVADGDPLEVGTEVEVVAVDGLIAEVRSHQGS